MKKHYSTNLSDEQWGAICWVVLPAPTERGRPRKWPLRTLVDAILYLTRAGCAWRLLPGDFPPWQTVYGYFARWSELGLWDRLVALLRSLARLWFGRNALPSAAIMDSQAVRCGRQKGVRGYDAAHFTWGRKRQMLTDTVGWPLEVEVTGGDLQDRSAAWRFLPGWLERFESPCATSGWTKAARASPWPGPSRPWRWSLSERPRARRAFRFSPSAGRSKPPGARAFNGRRLRSDCEEKLLHSRAFLLAAFSGLLLHKLCH
jgi:putative transposase